MSSSYGKILNLTIFGQSHSKAIGMVLDGVPAGEKTDFEQLNKFLQRRSPKNEVYSTSRNESDIPEILCGYSQNTTCGTPICAVIKNDDIKKEDYKTIFEIPRPGHADFTAYEKYGENADFSGGGHFSGRLTAPLCVAGGICLQILENTGIKIITRIASIYNIKDQGELISSTSEKPFPTVNDECGKKMLKAIAEAKSENDSLGGIIECSIIGLQSGIGNPIFDGMENRISSIIFGIPAVKGIEFGSGFDSTLKYGSQNNDEYCFENGKVKTKGNNCGGILGGITNGMPLNFRVAIKPTPSISKTQNTVNLKSEKNTEIKIGGRHDACIVPRAVPCVEAAAAIAVYDAILQRKTEI